MLRTKALVKLPGYFTEPHAWISLQNQCVILAGWALKEEAELVVLLCLIPLLATRKADELMLN